LTSGSATVTVCTYHVALGNLVEDAGPASIADAWRYIERLIALMVELQDERVVFAAVRARMSPEVLK
jgi:hypothetical protein